MANALFFILGLQVLVLRSRHWHLLLTLATAIAVGTLAAGSLASVLGISGVAAAAVTAKIVALLIAIKLSRPYFDGLGLKAFSKAIFPAITMGVSLAVAKLDSLWAIIPAAAAIYGTTWAFCYWKTIPGLLAWRYRPQRP
jgi:hypothetical protein